MKYSHLSVFALIPFVTYAQTNNFDTLLAKITSIIELLIPIAFSLIVLAFFWGLALFILNTGNTDAHKRGRELMLWGVIALFVVTSLWGIIAYLQESFEVDNSTRPDTPRLEVNL